MTYTYDALNRLASATNSGATPAWGESYGYDGFGNLTTKTVTQGAGNPLSVSYNASTNRRTTDCADANGNIGEAAACTNGMYYDMSNRIVRNEGTLAWAYSYDPGNKRIWRGNWSGGSQAVDELTFYGVNGQKLRTYTLSASSATAVATSAYEYFGGKLIKNAGGYVVPDRLGSIGKYFPWGEQRPSATSNGKEKFATYFRDSETGLDYAQNRYHDPGDGRFLTPDPYMANTGGAGDPANPSSWNRYAYVGGDPVNRADPLGLYLSFATKEEAFWYCWPPGGDTDRECYLEGVSIDGGNNVYHTWEALEGASQGNAQGKGGNVQIKVTRLSTDNANANLVQDDLRRLKDLIAMDETCSGWLRSSGSGIDYALGVAGTGVGPGGSDGMKIGVARFDDNSVNGIQGTEGTDMTPGSMIITINTEGAYFNSNGRMGPGVPSTIRAGTGLARAFILLHELAHYVGAAGFHDNDRGGAVDTRLQTENNGAVWANCRGVLDMW